VKRVSEAKRNRRVLQDEIKAKHTGILNQKKAELCYACCNYDQYSCKYNLLPVTLGGKDCPYFGCKPKLISVQ